MASIRIPGPPEAGPAAEPWPSIVNDCDEHTIRVDEMFARRLDTEFAAGVRGLLHDPETGLSSLGGFRASSLVQGWQGSEFADAQLSAPRWRIKRPT
jgi:hypothetical protein